MTRSCFFLAKGMADGSLGKEIQLKSISDEVVFCHPIIPKGAHFRAPFAFTLFYGILKETLFWRTLLKRSQNA